MMEVRISVRVCGRYVLGGATDCSLLLGFYPRSYVFIDSMLNLYLVMHEVITQAGRLPKPGEGPPPEDAPKMIKTCAV
jgi:hypothetical protein